jgi:hypothetical protein
MSSSLSYFYNLLLSCSDDEEPPAYDTAAPSTSPAATNEPAELAVAVRTTRSSIKKVSQSQARNLKRAKKAKETDVSLEAHVSTVSSDDVGDFSLPALLLYTPSLTYSFPSGSSKEIYRLGHGMRRVPKGCGSFRKYNFDV